MFLLLFRRVATSHNYSISNMFLPSSSLSLCWSACPFLINVNSGKTTDSIETSFGMVGQRNHALDWSIPYWEGGVSGVLVSTGLYWIFQCILSGERI